MNKLSFPLLGLVALLLVACASRVSEPLPAEAGLEIVAEGSFVGADSSHNGTRRATLYRSPSGQRILRFTDFDVTPGPDLKVWLVARPAVASSADVSEAETRDLGVLKGTIGAQNYVVPGDLDLTRYQTVVDWCEAFGVLFASAVVASAS